MNGRWRSLTCVCLAIVVVTAIAQAQQRDRPSAAMAPAAATGSVSGIVTASLTSAEPVRRAVVSLVSVNGGDGAATVADDEGKFTIRSVPAGRYSLVAEKPSFLTSSYGARRPGRPGVTVVVASGEDVTGLRIALPKGGVIAGRVVTPDGEPWRNTQVMAVPMSQSTAGGRLDSRAKTFFTDDLGAYRIYGLMPDDYLVAALPTIGRGDVEVRTDATNAARFGYAPTYYPGTPVPADGAPIRVGIGEVKDGVDLSITLLPLGTISGTVRDVDGQPTRAVRLSLESVGPPLPSLIAATIRVDPPDSEGRFSITKVPPGSYRLVASGGGMTVSGNTVTTRTADQTDWASMPLQINGHDIDNIVLSLQKGLTFSGHVVAHGTTSPSLAGTRVAIAEQGANPSSARSATVGDDGAFVVTGLRPARYEVIVAYMPSAISSTWAVRSVTADGVELRDRPSLFENGSIDDATITLTDQRTEVAGTFATASGASATDYYIVVFPADRALWHPLSPRVRAVRPGVDGSFSIRDLPAGDYRIAALTDVERDEWRQTSFLESLLSTSVSITLTEGMTTRQDFRIR